MTLFLCISVILLFLRPEGALLGHARQQVEKCLSCVFSQTNIICRRGLAGQLQHCWAQMGSAGLGSRLHLVLNVSSHSSTSVSTEYFFLMAGDKGTSSKNSYSSIFSASACIKFINIPLTKASHMAQPKVSRVRIDILPTLLGGPVEL